MLLSCASVPSSVPEGLSAAELVQRAQEASDSYNYRAAAVYYRTALERFGDDPAVRCACTYELAFIAYRQGRPGEARTGMKAVLEIYAGPDGSGIPDTYLILAKKILQKLG
jgi:outer membrane protein assembly factor BamD (BamD/ComL family)